MESKEHWNTLCLGIVTVATAAVGTVLFASGLAEVELSDSVLSRLLPEVTKVVFGVVAIVLYLVLTVISGLIIFGETAQESSNEIHIKRRTRVVYWLFVAELIALFFLLVSNIFETNLNLFLVRILREC